MLSKKIGLQFFTMLYERIYLVKNLGESLPGFDLQHEVKIMGYSESKTYNVGLNKCLLFLMDQAAANLMFTFSLNKGRQYQACLLIFS